VRDLRIPVVLSALLLAGCSAQAPDGPELTLKPSAPSKPKPVSPAAPEGITDGKYLVGTDIPAGTYRTLGVAPGSATQLCIWDLSKDDSADYGAFIDSRSGTGPDRVTLKAGQFFGTDGCKPWIRQ
jgi:hypothetical protein